MIHPTAIVDSSARIAADVEVGPYTIIGPDVKIDEGCWIGPHVIIQRNTTIGKHNKIFQFASIGEDPQDKKFNGENTRLEIGDHNIIRESCTFNRGTVQDNGLTQIGSHNLFMAYVHVAHDCVVGDYTIFANNASLAGHVTVDDYACLGGFSGVFQGCRVGRFSFSSMGSMIDKDIPPFVKVSGYYAKPFGLNTVGMKRQGFTDNMVLGLKRAYKVLYRKGYTVVEAIAELKRMLDEFPDVRIMMEFVQASERGILR
jgi:UDP-N-acetylglucosamine acyltransferase